jgi:hypothetical protein
MDKASGLSALAYSDMPDSAAILTRCCIMANLDGRFFGTALRAYALLHAGRSLPASHDERQSMLGITRGLYMRHRHAYDQALAIARELAQHLTPVQTHTPGQMNSSTDKPDEIPQSHASQDVAPDKTTCSEKPVYARVGVSMFSTSTKENENNPKTFLPRKVYERVRNVFREFKTRCASEGVELHQPDNPVFGRLWLQVRGEMYAAARAAGVELETIVDRLAPVVAALERAGGGLLAFVHNWRRGDYATLMPAPRTSKRTGAVSVPQAVDGGAAAHDPRTTRAVLDELNSIKLAAADTRETHVGGLRAFFRSKGWAASALATT